MPSYIVDTWTMIHFASWMCIGVVMSACGARLRTILLITLGAGLAWEAAEHGVVERLLGFDEPWYNGAVDIAANMLGATFGALLTRNGDKLS